MASPKRNQEPVLDERVRAGIARARQSSFFALVAMLERLTPDAARVGGDGPVAHEVLRFRNEPSMGFPAGDVSCASIREVARKPSAPLEGRREVVDIVTAFLGVTGSVSPLPLYLAAEVAHDTGPHNVQRDFLDIFHHRLISLLYRMWMRYQCARESLSDNTDPWSLRMLALSGFDAFDETASLPVPAGELLRLVPLLTTRARTAETLTLALASVLRDELEVDSTGRCVAPSIEQLVGGFVALDETQRMRLATATSVLGRTSILGARARDRASSFAIELRLRSGVDATGYMIGGDKLELIRKVVVSLLHEPLDFELRIVIGTGEQRGFALRGPVLRGPAQRDPASTPSERAALGRQTWLRGHAHEQRFTVPNVTNTRRTSHESSAESFA